jgi:hypothetical protein
MKKLLAILFALAICASRAQGQFMPMQTTGGFLRLVQTIPLPTDGYMDHLAADVKGQRLFICGEASKGLVTVDLRAGKVIHFTQGLPAMPKKPFYLADSNEIWVTMTDSTVVAFSGTTYEPIKTVRLSEFGNPKAGADNAAYDPNAHLLYAGVEVFSEGTNDRPTPMGARYGGGDNHMPAGASIDMVDTETARLVGTVKLPGGDPAGIALEPSGKRLYVTMGDIIDGDSHVAVVDLEKRAVVAQWPITGGPVPHTAALDPIHHRLLVGSRLKPNTGEIGGGHQHEPGKLVVMDTETGRVVQALDSVGGADDVFYDQATGRVYYTGTTGYVAVFQEKNPDHFECLGKVPTGAVSKTGLWVPELRRFYSAVPNHYVITAPHGTKNFRADMLRELTLKEGEAAPMLSNLITEEAHLMVFDYLP